MTRASSNSRSLVFHSASNTVATRRLSGSTDLLAALRQVGFILRTFDLEMTQALRFCRSVHELLLHGDRQRQGFWSHVLDQQPCNGPIQPSPRKALPGRLSPLNALVCTQIIGHDALTAALMVAHRHAFSALAADEEPW